MNYQQVSGNTAPAVAMEPHARPSINTSFKEESNTLNPGPSRSSDVAKSHLAAVKASLIFESLTQMKILFIQREIGCNLLES